MKCVNCGNVNEIAATGIYTGYQKCAECGFLKGKSTQQTNIIMPEDPMDAMMCESCQ